MSATLTLPVALRTGKLAVKEPPSAKRRVTGTDWPGRSAAVGDMHIM